MDIRILEAQLSNVRETLRNTQISYANDRNELFELRKQKAQLMYDARNQSSCVIN